MKNWGSNSLVIAPASLGLPANQDYVEGGVTIAPAGGYSRTRPIEEAHMKVVHCPCGTDVAGATDDELVANVEAHLASDHPDMAGKYSREQILAMAHEH
jgi:hypothetical protein